MQVAAKPPLADDVVELSTGMMVVCGLNGVGKTTLLRLIEGSLGDTESISSRVRSELISDGDFRLNLTEDAVGRTLRLGDANTAPTLVIDVFDACARILDVTTQSNFEDLLEGVDPHEYTSDELRTANYVVGKRYERLEVFEIEEPDLEDSLLPFFRASATGIEYDSRNMGLGELAALFSLWSLSRAEPGTVVLLEEPETFLSSHASVALVDVLARTVVSRRLYAVLTTHSAGIVARTPLEVLRVLTPSEVGVTIRRPQSRADLEHVLGSFVGQARIALVEDRTAAVVVSELLGRLGGLWGQAVEVLAVRNGVAELIALCRTLPQARDLRMVGVLDGDQSVPDESIWPIVTLPPPDNPDAMLRSAALTNLDCFSHALGRSRQILDAALPPLEGLDDHDWFVRVADSLALDHGAVLRAGVEAWLDDAANQSVADALIKAIVATLVS